LAIFVNYFWSRAN